MQIIHVNLANGLGGGEYQTLALMEALHSTVGQLLIHRQNSPLADLARQRSLRTMSASKAFLSPSIPCWRKPVVIHAHDGRGVHWARISARLHGLPYLITRRVLKSPQRRRWTQSAYAGASCIACVSQAVLDSLHDYNSTLQTCVVYDGQVSFASDAAHVGGLRESNPDKIIVAQVGRLSAEKEVRVTLEVARLLAVKKLPIHFWIIGDGPLGDSLRAASRDLDNVEFLGHRSDIGNYLAAADVLMHPSRSEAFGSVIVEAMQHNVAVIASRVGGIPEVVSDNETGLLIDIADVSAFSAALERLCVDPATRTRLAEAGCQRAEFFSLQKMTERYLELYHEILASHQEAGL